MRKSAKVAIAGAILFLGSLLLGIGGTIVGMVRSFNTVAESGSASAEELSQGISCSLISTMVGIPFALVGFCLLIGGAIAYFTHGRSEAAEE
ncbi:MAG: hypothetical protein HN742_41535 [Lentisphaerae bacterium]|jgi:hypothetical protein|nr:hypothetical protein [Lentisphaerota bacterium]MBT4816971.1 hypothetical protein [Lentisphaerota bacterium]MBT5611743.1 hypothetical protein [Lentisphaerota bacterium]MBT7054145.1 hypothetical protein [Lentisphaerota bacterium]MBT7848420.1 hypothetical protein [Lentisphaerota bacterium]